MKGTETMTTTNKTLRAEMLIEWFNDRAGAEVFGEVVAILRNAGATITTIPSAGWLMYNPANDGGEGELYFTFTHGLSWDNGETAEVINLVRKVARLKMCDWDLDATREWD